MSIGDYAFFKKEDSGRVEKVLRSISFSEEVLVGLFFFFSSRRRHTRFDCDWSSDVCSSDLDFANFIGALSKTLDLFRRFLNILTNNQHSVDRLAYSLLTSISIMQCILRC